MTPHLAPEPPTEPASADTPEPEKGTDDTAALRMEAANYRRKLRAAEAERDKLAAQVDQRDRADVERMAETRMGGGLRPLDGGRRVDELRGEDGALAPERIEAAVQ